MRRLVAWLPIIALLFVTFAGCDSPMDDDDDPPVASDTFELQVDGDETDLDIEGESFFFSGSIPETDEEAFVLYFVKGLENMEGNGAPSEEFTMGVAARANTDIQQGETYPIISAEDFEEIEDIEEGLPSNFIFYMMQWSQNEFAAFASQSGSITFSTASSDRVVGTFEVTAQAFRSSMEQEEPEPELVQITGSFDASSHPYFMFEGH